MKKIKLIFPDWGRFPLVYRRHIQVMGPAIVAGLTPPDYEIAFSDGRVEEVGLDGNYDLVAISMMTSQANRAYEIAADCRRRGIPVVLGGVHASLMPEEAAKHADAVVIGEAEGTWPDVLKDFSNGRLKPLYKCETPVANAPKPDWKIFKKGMYIPMNSVQVSRGCPVNCEMCSVPQSFGTEFRMFDTENLLKDIAGLEKFIFLVNDNIHLAKRRIRPFLEGLSGMDKEWVGLSPLNIASDEDYLKLLRKSNCWAMYIDLSPWVSAGLNEVVDGVQVAKTSEYIRKIRDNGIKVIASFVFGFDHDRKDIFEKTVDFAKNNGIEESEFHILTPYPKSRLHERLASEGRLLSRNFTDYSSSSAVFTPKHMTPEELNQGFLDAWRMFYSDGRCVETPHGPVVKSFSGFPLSEEEIRGRGIPWMNSVYSAGEAEARNV